MAVKGELRKYLGAINSEEQAARFYDKYLIIIQGIKAKTNFSYTRDQAIQLLNQSDAVRGDGRQKVNRNLNDIRNKAQDTGSFKNDTASKAQRAPMRMNDPMSPETTMGFQTLQAAPQ